jgi:hypothetical protein
MQRTIRCEAKGDIDNVSISLRLNLIPVFVRPGKKLIPRTLG